MKQKLKWIKRARKMPPQSAIDASQAGQLHAQTAPETARAELTFDGCGINGPDKYRTRLCTFTEVRGPNAKKYGPLFAAAPDLLAALELAHEALGETHGYHQGTTAGTIRAAIRKAKGGQK